MQHRIGHALHTTYAHLTRGGVEERQELGGAAADVLVGDPLWLTFTYPSLTRLR